MGMETLALRMAKHCENAQKVAEFLEGHPKVKSGFEPAKKTVNAVKMISLIANLGDIRTLIAHPASMMHSQLTEEQQKAAGASPEVIRLSIGCEDAKDIIADLSQALDSI